MQMHFKSELQLTSPMKRGDVEIMQQALYRAGIARALIACNPRPGREHHSSLPKIDLVAAEPVPHFEIVSCQTNDA